MLVDEFLQSQRFRVICAQALQLAACLPQSPPPVEFTSFTATPMHQWYEALLAEFVECFARHLRRRGSYPVRAFVGWNSSDIKFEEDTDAFNQEAILHINAILRSFRTFLRPLRSCDNLYINKAAAHARAAEDALIEATAPSSSPPKANYKAGDPLPAEFRRRLAMFRIGVIRILQDSAADRWVLEAPGQLERGVAAYEEFYVAHLRQEWLKARTHPTPPALSRERKVKKEQDMGRRGGGLLFSPTKGDA